MCRRSVWNMLKSHDLSVLSGGWQRCRLSFHIQLIIYSKPSHPWCERTSTHDLSHQSPPHIQFVTINSAEPPSRPKNPKTNNIPTIISHTRTAGLFKPCDALTPIVISSHIHSSSLFLRHIKHRERFHRLNNKKEALCGYKNTKRVPENLLAFSFFVLRELLSSFRIRIRVEHLLLCARNIWRRKNQKEKWKCQSVARIRN